MSRARHTKKMAKGGAAGGNHKYNAEGTPAMKEDEDKKDAFKRGGKVHGKKPPMRSDRKQRRADGGKVSGSRSPFSSAANPKGRPGGDYAEHTDKEDN